MKRSRTRLKHIRQSVRLVWSSAPGWTVLQGLLVLVQGVLPVAALFLTRRVVDAASAFMGQAPGAREPWSLLALAPWVAAVAGAGWLCRAFSALVVSAQVEVVADTVQDALQAKSVDVDLAYYETSSYHDQMRLAQAEATGRATSIVRNLVQLGSGSIVLVSVASVLAGTQGDGNWRRDAEPLAPEEFIGRVEEADGPLGRRPVVGGARGLRRARARHVVAFVRWGVLSVAAPFYRVLRASRIVSCLWRPEVQVAQFAATGGIQTKFIHRGQTIACWQRQTRVWTCQAPYDLILFPPTS